MLLRQPSVRWNKSKTRWKNTFREFARINILSSKSDNHMRTFFVEQPDHNFFPLSEATRRDTLLRQPSVQ